MISRRLTAVTTAAALCLAGAPGLAQAKATATNHHVTRHLTGVVRKIDVPGHRIVLAVRGKHGHVQRVPVNIATAHVTGNGVVSVGAKVKVTVTVTGSQVAASEVQVIGEPNGGQSGKGAAIAGTVTAVDAAADEFTLTASSDSGSSGPSSVIVQLTASTIIAVKHDGVPSISDIHVGDRAVVFTPDSTASPVVALGVLDASAPGGNGHQGGQHQYFKYEGPVTAVDQTAGTVTINVFHSSQSGERKKDRAHDDQPQFTLTVTVTDHTVFGGDGSNHQGAGGLQSVQVGDQLTVISTQPQQNGTVTAAGIDDHGPVSEQPHALKGKVTAVDQTAGTVTVLTDSTSVTVTAGAQTKLLLADTNGDGTVGLDDVQVGDQVAVEFTGAPSAQVSAAVIYDISHPPSQDPPPPPHPDHFRGTVTAVDAADATATVTVTDGPQEGQSVTVTVTDQTKLLVADTNGDGSANLADFQAGDNVQVGYQGPFSTSIAATVIYDVTHPAEHH